MELSKNECSLVAMLCRAELRFLDSVEDLGIQVLPLRKAVLDLQSKAQDGSRKEDEKKVEEAKKE